MSPSGGRIGVVPAVPLPSGRNAVVNKTVAEKQAFSDLVHAVIKSLTLFWSADSAHRNLNGVLALTTELMSNTSKTTKVRNVKQNSKSNIPFSRVVAASGDALQAFAKKANLRFKLLVDSQYRIDQGLGPIQPSEAVDIVNPKLLAKDLAAAAPHLYALAVGQTRYRWKDGNGTFRLNRVRARSSNAANAGVDDGEDDVLSDSSDLGHDGSSSDEDVDASNGGGSSSSKGAVRSAGSGSSARVGAGGASLAPMRTQARRGHFDTGAQKERKRKRNRGGSKGRKVAVKVHAPPLKVGSPAYNAWMDHRVGLVALTYLNCACAMNHQAAADYQLYLGLQESSSSSGGESNRAFAKFRHACGLGSPMLSTQYHLTAHAGIMAAVVESFNRKRRERLLPGVVFKVNDNRNEHLKVRAGKVGTEVKSDSMAGEQVTQKASFDGWSPNGPRYICVDTTHPRYIGAAVHAMTRGAPFTNIRQSAHHAGGVVSVQPGPRLSSSPPLEEYNAGFKLDFNFRELTAAHKVNGKVVSNADGLHPVTGMPVFVNGDGSTPSDEHTVFVQFASWYDIPIIWPKCVDNHDGFLPNGITTFREKERELEEQRTVEAIAVSVKEYGACGPHKQGPSAGEYGAADSHVKKFGDLGDVYDQETGRRFPAITLDEPMVPANEASSVGFKLWYDAMANGSEVNYDGPLSDGHDQSHATEHTSDTLTHAHASALLHDTVKVFEDFENDGKFLAEPEIVEDARKEITRLLNYKAGYGDLHAYFLQRQRYCGNPIVAAMLNVIAAHLGETGLTWEKSGHAEHAKDYFCKKLLAALMNAALREYMEGSDTLPWPKPPVKPATQSGLKWVPITDVPDVTKSRNSRTIKFYNGDEVTPNGTGILVVKTLAAAPSHVPSATEQSIEGAVVLDFALDPRTPLSAKANAGSAKLKSGKANSADNIKEFRSLSDRANWVVNGGSKLEPIVLVRILQNAHNDPASHAKNVAVYNSSFYQGFSDYLDLKAMLARVEHPSTAKTQPAGTINVVLIHLLKHLLLLKQFKQTWQKTERDSYRVIKRTFHRHLDGQRAPNMTMHLTNVAASELCESPYLCLNLDNAFTSLLMGKLLEAALAYDERQERRIEFSKEAPTSIDTEGAFELASRRATAMALIASAKASAEAFVSRDGSDPVQTVQRGSANRAIKGEVRRLEHLLTLMGYGCSAGLPMSSNPARLATSVTPLTFPIKNEDGEVTTSVEAVFTAKVFDVTKSGDGISLESSLGGVVASKLGSTVIGVVADNKYFCTNPHGSNESKGCYVLAAGAGFDGAHPLKLAARADVEFIPSYGDTIRSRRVPGGGGGGFAEITDCKYPMSVGDVVLGLYPIEAGTAGLYNATPKHVTGMLSGADRVVAKDFEWLKKRQDEITRAGANYAVLVLRRKMPLVSLQDVLGTSYEGVPARLKLLTSKKDAPVRRAAQAFKLNEQTPHERMEASVYRLAVKTGPFHDAVHVERAMRKSTKRKGTTARVKKGKQRKLASMNASDMILVFEGDRLATTDLSTSSKHMQRVQRRIEKWRPYVTNAAKFANGAPPRQPATATSPASPVQPTSASPASAATTPAHAQAQALTQTSPSTPSMATSSTDLLIERRKWQQSLLKALATYSDLESTLITAYAANPKEPETIAAIDEELREAETALQTVREEYAKVNQKYTEEMLKLSGGTPISSAAPMVVHGCEDEDSDGEYVIPAPVFAAGGMMSRLLAECDGTDGNVPVDD